MSNSWIDILTGLTPNLNQPVLHGQWMLTSPDTTFRINGLEVRERDRLVAQKSCLVLWEVWRLLRERKFCTTNFAK